MVAIDAIRACRQVSLFTPFLCQTSLSDARSSSNFGGRGTISFQRGNAWICSDSVRSGRPERSFRLDRAESRVQSSRWPGEAAEEAGVNDDALGGSQGGKQGTADMDTFVQGGISTDLVNSIPFLPEGQVVFRRSSTQKHFVFRTTLERLDLHHMSSPLSQQLAAKMKLVVGEPPEANLETATSSRDNVQPVKDSSEGASVKAYSANTGLPEGSPVGKVFETPVEISIDVQKEGDDLRLDGVARTAVSTHCSLCGKHVAARVTGDFSLLLLNQAVNEPSQKSIGVVLGNNARWQDTAGSVEGGYDLLDLDIDDKIHFPKDVQQVDLTSYMRDTIHLKVPLAVHCKAGCKGLCIGCRVNLNEVKCQCRKRTGDLRWGALEQLRLQMEHEKDAS